MVLELAGPIDALAAAESECHRPEVSGGLWYGVELPNRSADPLVLEEPHGLNFTAYLALALDWVGFPGLERATQHTWSLATLRRLPIRG